MLPHLIAAAAVSHYLQYLEYSFAVSAAIGIAAGYLPFYFNRLEKRSGYFGPSFRDYHFGNLYPGTTPAR